MKTQSPKKEPTGLRLDDKREGITLSKPNSTILEVENHLEEKFQIDLTLDLEKADSFSGNKLPHNGGKHNTEKTVQPGSVPLLMSVAGWPGRLPSTSHLSCSYSYFVICSFAIHSLKIPKIEYSKIVGQIH